MHTSEFHHAWLTAEGDNGHSGQPEATFPWWSFTKTVLAAAVLRLVEAGRLQLDTPWRGKPFTLRQLLQHRAGLPDYGHLEAYKHAVAAGEEPWPRKRLLAEAEADRLRYEPDTGWAYSNVGYLYVREAVEEATGQHLGAALRTLVLEPLGFTRPYLAETVADLQQTATPPPAGYAPGWVYHGSLIGTLPDAAGLLQALLTTDFLRPETRAQFTARHPLDFMMPDRPWSACGYGLGLMAGAIDDLGPTFGHTGQGPGSVIGVCHFPEAHPPVTAAVACASEPMGVMEFELVRVAARRSEAANHAFAPSRLQD
ncbi:MAG: serine hydrolase domain-containing protein [Verrucomicrobiota bacterium JB022]|nr:serine hydrolase domain-containing protein [Verrucomicrobiota bacterium JB022]